MLPDVDSQRSFSGIYNKDFPSFHIFQIIHLGLFSIEFLNSYLDLIFFFLLLLGLELGRAGAAAGLDLGLGPWVGCCESVSGNTQHKSTQNSQFFPSFPDIDSHQMGLGMISMGFEFSF